MSEMIAANLRRLMRQRSWQQRDLADAAGLSEASVCRILSGRQDNPTIRTLQVLAQALNVRIVDLLGEQSSEVEERGELESQLLALYHLLPREERLKVVEYAEAMVAKRERDERLQRRRVAATEAYGTAALQAEP